MAPSLRFVLLSSFAPLLFSPTSKAQSRQHTFPTHYILHTLHADILPLSRLEKQALADTVIEGEVIATQSYWKDNRIASSLTIKSNTDTSVYDVRLIGGAFDDIGSFYTGEMYLNTGAMGSFYLRGSQVEGWNPACGVQSYEPHQRRALAMGFNRNMVELSMDWAAGNGMELLTITGSGFGNTQGNGYVTFETGNGYYNADDAANFNYPEWSNTSITIEVPQAQSNRVRVVTNDGNTFESNDSLHIRYNLDSEPFSPYGYTHLYNNNGAGNYLFHVNESIFNVPERLEAVQRTLDDFVCKTGVNFQLNDMPTSLGWDLGDGQNTITFDTPENPLAPGTVGYCNTLWWSCILGDITFYVAGEIDIVLNSNFDYDYSTGWPETGQTKFTYVLMHEMGHAMRLGHVNEWGESMYPTVTDWPSQNWHVRDTISTNDRLGVSHAVDIASTFTFNACGISTMHPLEIDCETEAALTESTEATAQVPYPNPFNNFIALPSAEAIWTLMDVNGSLIKRTSSKCSRIETERLPKGSYLLRRTDNYVSRTYRLIKD